MKLLLVLTFVALVCIARSAPPSSPQDRTLILPNYDQEDEIEINNDEDSDEELNTTPETTRTTMMTTTSRRSTYVFPTKTYTTPTVRRPWLTQRTTTTVANEFDIESIDINSPENGYDYFKNIREFFKKLAEDLKKFFQKFDIIKAIKQFFNRNTED